MDLCGRIDLSPIAGLSLVKERTYPKPPLSAPGAACLFGLRAPGGYEGSLRVEASTPAAVDDAVRLFRATGQVTSMTPEGRLAGVGDEAEAFSKRSEPGAKYAEYLIHARRGNLVVKVWLAVAGDSFAAKEELAAAAMAITKDTFALVPLG